MARLLTSWKGFLGRGRPDELQVDSKVITATDAKLAGLISEEEFDYEQIQQVRRQNRNEVLKLQRAMERLTERPDMPVLEQRSMENIRKYEAAAKRELRDLILIITQLRELIQSEDTELVYDLRRPLKVFEDFMEGLKRALHGLKLQGTLGRKVYTILKAIEMQYTTLTDQTIKFIEQDFKYYNSIGLDFSKFAEGKETDYALVTHLKTRAKLKQQINGKTQWIIKQIEQLEQIFAKLKAAKKITPKLGDEVFERLEHFRKQFEGVVDFSLKRIGVANHMIIESVILQRDHYVRLEKLKKELVSFYQEFLEEQEHLSKQGHPRWKTKQILKRIDDFKKYQKEAEASLEHFEKSFEKKIMGAEREDLEAMKMEKREAGRIKARITQVKGRWKRGVVMALLVLTGLGATAATFPSGSAVGAVRDSTISFLMHPASQIEMIQNLKKANIEEMQTEIGVLNIKMQRGEQLSKEERTFIANIFQMLVIGGLKKEMTEASKLINHYVNGTGSSIEIDSSVYQESRIVQHTMELMSNHLREQYAQGKIKEGSRGVISSKDVLKPKRFRGGVEKEGQILGGGALLAEQENLALKNTDNRFFLNAEYEVNEGKIRIRWFVDSYYDFENNPDHVTHIPLPGSDKILRIPDTLSHNMVRYSLSKEFSYHSSWESEVGV